MIKKAFYMTLLDKNNDFLTEDEIGLGENPDINDLISHNFLKFTSNNISADFGDGNFLYDNDGDGEIQIIIRNSTNETISSELKRILGDVFQQTDYYDSAYYNLK